MIPPPVMCDWARHLLASEAVADANSEQPEPATLVVFEKLRRQLCAPVGIDGFHALAARALMLAKSEAPRLSAFQVTAEGRTLLDVISIEATFRAALGSGCRQRSCGSLRSE